MNNMMTRNDNADQKIAPIRCDKCAIWVYISLSDIERLLDAGITKYLCADCLKKRRNEPQ